MLPVTVRIKMTCSLGGSEAFIGIMNPADPPLFSIIAFMYWIDAATAAPAPVLAATSLLP